MLEYTGLDLALVMPFYDPSLKVWPYNSHWLTSDILHSGGRDFVEVVGVLILMVFILSFFVDRLKSYRKGSGYLLLACLLGLALVAIGKGVTHIYSPWDLRIFGGSQPYIRLFDPVPEGAVVGHAFPAGHSSGGFAFFSLYFLAKEYKPHLRMYGLLIALAIGFTFGFGQQMRGAHFFSHDLFSLVICWYASLITYVFYFKRESLRSWMGSFLIVHKGRGKY
ncbi:MAG: phosphatase PAP2 family protein [Desulfoarculaceae bacterium]|nr:phosphatase PAP2 family protein [Desulfoarculaceae bacterium]